MEDNLLQISNQQIVEKIRKKYNGKDIMYLTESDGRYISSWLNIMRDDYGILDFKSRSNDRKLIYDITNLKKEKSIDLIKHRSMAKAYIEDFYNII